MLVCHRVFNQNEEHFILNLFYEMQKLYSTWKCWSISAGWMLENWMLTATIRVKKKMESGRFEWRFFSPKVDLDSDKKAAYCIHTNRIQNNYYHLVEHMENPSEWSVCAAKESKPSVCFCFFFYLFIWVLNAVPLGVSIVFSAFSAISTNNLL